MRKFANPTMLDLFLNCLEQTRTRHNMRIYGFFVMPEHVHIIVSEPDTTLLATAIKSLKLAVAKRADLPAHTRFWQSRYYGANIRTYDAFVETLRYIHRNPFKRGLVPKPEDWPWSSFRHYAVGEIGMVEIESERTAHNRQERPTN
jgi:putative transposase